MEYDAAFLSANEHLLMNGDIPVLLFNLEEMYIYATNPNSFGVAGTSFKLNPAITIYVPKGSKEMYQNSTTWATHKDQIKEME